MSGVEVSVIVLTYNHEDFIVSALESVEDQDFLNIQVVIGDDASDDSTCALIESFEKKSRLKFDKVFSDKNRGITKNFNACLSRCTGEIIFLLGGDDIFLPGKISAQVKHMLNDPSISISYHDVEVFDSESNRTLYYYNNVHGRQEGGASVLVERGAFNCGCSVAVRNRNLPMCDERIKFASDWLWYIETLMSGGGNIKYIDGVFARYRRHGNNITGSAYLNQQYQEILLSLDIIKEKYPSLITVVAQAESERVFAFFIKFLLVHDYKKAFYLLRRALSVNVLSPFVFFRIRVRRIFKIFR
ncbi:glycosyltransferase [Pseudomonas agarici]|uniref:glycosyltransferase n=1 Tax=Pseudomonas agarici TaxID=46677 RepID=UPI0015A42A12|nr:glycosyltransferase [Pseudomonas agarici]NWB91697.1 glycosyltransferase [Pseudomonas agarici]